DPAEFMVVPHRDKRPACASVLQIGVMQVGAIDSAIVFDSGGNMKVLNFFSVFITNDVPQTAVVHSLRSVFGVPDEFIDEVTEMQHESETILLFRPFIFKNHSPICILGTLVDILTRYECKAHWPFIIVCRGSNRPADSTPITRFIGKAIPIHP